MALAEQEEEERERYRELLEELRVVLPGVQVLFGFLLTAPFSARFAELDQVGRKGYFVALACAALSTVLFMMPTSHHRIAPRQERRRRVQVGVQVTLGGMAALAVAIPVALFVVTRFVFGNTEARALTAALVIAMAVLWYAIPIRERLSGRG